MSECGSCTKGFANNHYRVSCTACFKVFHLQCQKLKKEDYLFLKEQKSAFTCSGCVKSRRGSISSQESQESGSGDIQEGMSSPSSQNIPSTVGEISPGQLLSAINSLRAEVKSANVKFDKRYTEIREEMKDVKDHLNKYSDAIEKNTEKIDSLTAELSSMSDLFGGLNERCSSLEARVVELESQISDNDQLVLNNSVEISGIPSSNDKTALDLVKLVGAALGFDITDSMVNNCFRRRPNSASVNGGSIFLSFLRKIEKDCFMQASRQKRNLTSRDLGIIEGDASKIYINHSLTFAKRKLLNSVKTFKRENNFKFVWISNGNIFLKKDENAQPLLIKTTQDLLKNDRLGRSPRTS
ncbi:hypothetical protein GE061_011282 [Apolygus lucorum]|uniref:FP protein C-terminal domain-containing protein n=1 Tax=Apolygus lucorum TaxID=248454 RepID=A0A6A4JKA1_APOLU|nr:hypothetical protein GE061_011282 [Apolygus lucorum]